MKREILFRGKRRDNGEWVYGNLICSKNYAIGSQKFPLERPKVVDGDTIGQYTGLIDKSGNKIFERDIVNCKTILNDFEEYVIRWNGFKARFVIEKHWKDISMTDVFEYEIIGNIFDNPELMESRR